MLLMSGQPDTYFVNNKLNNEPTNLKIGPTNVRIKPTNYQQTMLNEKVEKIGEKGFRDFRCVCAVCLCDWEWFFCYNY